MKIDTHQHYWHYQASEFAWIDEAMPVLRRDRMPTDCAPDLQAAGVDGVVAVQARTVPEETDFLLGLAGRDSQVWGVVGWADLAAPDLDTRLSQWGEHAAFKGLRHLLQDEPDVAAWVGTPAINQGVQCLQQRELVYDVLVFAHQLHAVEAFCARHDRHWLVLDHVGKPDVRAWAKDPAAALRWRSGLEALAALPHVVCKLSGAVTETDWSHGLGVSEQDERTLMACFDRALDAFGPQRLMYGSDWPVCQLASDYTYVHGLAHRWACTRLNAAEQEAFWGGNALRCYGLGVQHQNA